MDSGRSRASASGDDLSERRGTLAEEGAGKSPNGFHQIASEPSFAYQATTPSDWQDAVAPSIGQDWSRLAVCMPDSSNCSSDGSCRRSSASAHSGRRKGGERVSRASASRHAEDVAWEHIRLAHRIRPCGHYAHCTDDLRLLGKFFELAGLQDIHSDSVKMLLRTLKFLRLCDYSVDDICSVLAHASAYFIIVDAICGDQMDSRELGNVLTTLIFLAHCFVQDETCPLHIWHQYLFRKYCPLKTLNAAVIRLMELLRFILRLRDDDLSHRFNSLRGATQLHLLTSPSPVFGV